MINDKEKILEKELDKEMKKEVETFEEDIRGKKGRVWL